MGSSIYQMGYQSAGVRCKAATAAALMIELDTLSQALERGARCGRLHGSPRRRISSAPTRSSAWKLRAGESELGRRRQLRIEYMVLGTAVRTQGRARSEQPGDDRAVGRRLRDARCAPASSRRGIVAWSSVFFATYAYREMFGAGGTMTSMQPHELSEFTQALYNARERTDRPDHRQAAALGASGVVGVRIGHAIRPHTLSSGMGGGFGASELRGMMVTFNAVGTAIRQHAHAEIQAPKPVVDLFA